MDTTSYKTVSANSNTVEKKWVLVDAENMVLGRLSSEIAKRLRGKHKPYYTPHVDCGDNIIVINAKGIRLTGNKWTDKTYVRHTGYPGGQRFSTPAELLEKNPSRIIEKAVYGMLPKTRLGNALKGNLYVYDGEEHPHEGQQPEKITL